MPQRQEKEPLRPLYIYYKKLKQYIDKRSKEQQQDTSTTVSSNNTLKYSGNS